jgi:hypothetical protein
LYHSAHEITRWGRCGRGRGYELWTVSLQFMSTEMCDRTGAVGFQVQMSECVLSVQFNRAF